MKRLLIVIAMAILGVVGMPGAAWADGCPTFLWMKPWYASPKVSENCSKIKEDAFNSDNLGETIREIAGTVTDDILIIVGVLAAGFLIYGGFQYIYSGGDTGKASRGKKTITAAIVGLIISIAGRLIINSVKTVFGVDEAMYGNTKPEELIDSVVNFALAAATVVAVGFTIFSGIQMLTSYGDPSKTAKARKGIIYSIAGLLVAMLAFAIISFVTEIMKGAGVAGTDADSGIFTVANNVFGTIIGVVGFLSVVGVVVGGVMYLTSGGDAAKVQKGKQTIIYSLVGLGIVIIGGTIISFVLNALLKQS